jgi:predicted phosphodiesterase
MSKLFIVGDTHADDSFVAYVHKEARSLGVDTIVQLGDFGYDFNRNMLASIEAWLNRDENHKWYWLDGNHDHHDYIEAVILAGQSWDHPVAHFHERMFYCPRGSTVKIGDKKCLFLGGAFSIDRYRRTLGVSWWEQEMIRYSDMERAVRNGTDIDVMFTHDVPPMAFIDDALRSANYKIDPDSSANRRNLGRVVEEVAPKHLYHGHYHWRYDDVLYTASGKVVEIHGVAANFNEFTESVIFEQWGEEVQNA